MTKVEVERRAGRPMDQAKRAAVLAAAQKLFIANGFARTSMDSIAEAAGVSKLTAYKYFGSKQALFAQAVAAKCRSAFDGFEIDHRPGHDLRACLSSFGQAFLKLILDPDAMAVHRLIAVECERTPELGRLFFENAVKPTRDRLAAIIARHEAAGEIVTGGDAMLAAQQLLALWRGRPYMTAELGLGAFDDAALTLHVEQAVDLCLKAWAPR